jgi:predicted porin
LENLEMKKTLVALAALAATSAFAQSSVSIVGVLDAGYKMTSHDDATKKANTVFNNGVSTSQFDFIGTQDLGSGLKAGFFMELDVNPANSSVLNQSGAGATQMSGTPFTGQQVVSLEGDFGRIKIGTPDSASLDASLTAQPFGTALGSGWSAGFGRLGTATVAGINQYVGGPNASARIIRHEKTVRYDTPVFSGLKASLEYSAKNDNSTTVTSNNNGYTSLGLQYANGPLNVQYANTKAEAGNNQAAGSMTVWGTAVANALAANNNVKYNILGANYNLGAATVYAGLTNTKDGTGLVEDSKSTNAAIKYVVGQVDLLANTLQRKSNLASQAANSTATMTGLGANYNFSKTVLAYYRYENIKNINVAGQAQTVNAVGLVVKF